MGYSNEVIQRARARLAQAKADRENENMRRLAQAYQQVPRLREIDRELRQSMVAAARSAFVSGEDGRAALQAVRQENQAIQNSSS